jgi:alpha-L-fucosidase
MRRSQIVKRINPPCAVREVGKDGLSGARHVSATVIRSWMWSPNAKLNPPEQLFSAFPKCQSAGKAFVLNVGPTPSGEIPGDQIAVLMQVKELIAKSPAQSLSPEPPGAKAPPAERLKQLKSLLDQGLINKEDYDRKAKEIIDSL